MIRTRLVWPALLTLAAVASSPVADAAPPSAPLGVRLVGLRSNRGRVGCLLYDGPRGFPSDPSAARDRTWCAIENQTSTCRFEAVPRGTYAVACFHDENGNGKCDTGLFGIPTEGTVVSNGAKGTFGPPKFEDAKFAFAATPTTLTLKMSC